MQLKRRYFIEMQSGRGLYQRSATASRTHTCHRVHCNLPLQQQQQQRVELHCTLGAIHDNHYGICKITGHRMRGKNLL